MAAIWEKEEVDQCGDWQKAGTPERNTDRAANRCYDRRTRNWSGRASAPAQFSRSATVSEACDLICGSYESQKRTILMKKKSMLRFLGLTLLTLTLSAAVLVSAAPISPGFDLWWTTSPGALDLSGLGLGMVDLKRILLDPGGGLGLDITDTIVLRKQGISPLNQGDTGTVDIELVALHLQSVNPVDLTPLGGPFVGVFADLHVTVNKEIEVIPDPGGNDDGICDGGETCMPAAGSLPVLDALDPSIGRMEIRHEDPDPFGGGTFDLCLGEVSDGPACGACGTLGVGGGGVFADAIFTNVGGDPADPLDRLLNLPAPRIALANLDGQWGHAGFLPYPIPPLFPAGDFFPLGFGMSQCGQDLFPAPVELLSFTIE